MNSNILSSWKAISAYTGFTERTLQRWEKKFGFPVHRPAGKARSAVSALVTEIDAWLSAAPSLPEIKQTFARYPGKLTNYLGKQIEKADKFASSAADLPASSIREQRLAPQAEFDHRASLDLTNTLVSGVYQMKLLIKEQRRERTEMVTLRAELASTCELSARARQKLQPPQLLFGFTQPKQSMP